MRMKKLSLVLVFPLALCGCGKTPKLSVLNTYSGAVFYEISAAGEPSAYLAGQMPAKIRRTLALRTGKNLLFFVKPDTTAGEENFITLDSLLTEEGKKYLLELNPQYVSGHQHNNPPANVRPPTGIQSTQNPLR
jgi:hypothetical protein